MYTSSCSARLYGTKREKNGGLWNGYTQSKGVAHKMAEEVHRLGSQGRFNCVPPISLINIGYVIDPNPSGTMG